jgi:hypothetical protein
MAYRLTVRHGSRVERESFDSLDAAIEAMERRSLQIRGEGPLEEVRTLRNFGPGQRVHARLELSTGGVIGGREVGIDVMGDGAFVPYAGMIRKRRLEARDDETAFRAVRDALK